MDVKGILVIFIIIVANIGVSLLIFRWATYHTEECTREIRELIQAIQIETKSFHDHLARLDADFKEFMKVQKDR